MTEDQWDAWLAERIRTKQQRRTNWSSPSPSDGDSHPAQADRPARAQATFVANLHRDDWMHDAACRGLSPRLFHLERGESTIHAEDTCATCPVADQCLEMAIADSSLLGVWGGMSRRERQAERRRRGIVNSRGRRQVDGPVRPVAA